jgi:alpha-beta hydrolase superfamily lysophospholipase
VRLLTDLRLRPLLRHGLLFLAYGAIGAAVALLAGYGVYLGGLPDLRPWHDAHLDAEFRAGDAGRVGSLAGYQALEDRLFAELRAEVYDRVPPGERAQLSRYTSGSLADPLAQPVNWNRTYELPASNPRGAALLLHGLSDSPYSLRAIAERLHAQGWHVVNLRIPGHGTAPAALLRTTWEDMAAAVRLAARDLAARMPPGKPLVMVGYSNGAALAVEYALARRQGQDLPPVAKLVLISPAIGVSPAAALAVWQGRVSVLLGRPKVAWNEIGPEYDPYKYTSFAVNAADQAHAITRRIREQLKALGAAGPVQGLPRILAFQSVADSTVSAPAVLDTLFRPLANKGHALVAFDINRHAELAELYTSAATRVRADVLTGPPLAFDLTVVANSSADTSAVALYHRPAGADQVDKSELGAAWPAGVYSLSHVALPFSPEDPVYGARAPQEETIIFLGRPELLGERGLLAVSPANLMRLRHNPFFEYLLARISAFLDDGTP